MLLHLCDISKIEVQAKDQYKLKVNTKEKYVTMFGDQFAFAFYRRLALFDQVVKGRTSKNRTLFDIFHV